MCFRRWHLFTFYIGTWPPAYQRAVLILSTAMLTFAAKIYQIPDLIDLVKSVVEFEVSFSFAMFLTLGM